MDAENKDETQIQEDYYKGGRAKGKQRWRRMLQLWLTLAPGPRLSLAIKSTRTWKRKDKRLCFWTQKQGQGLWWLQTLQRLWKVEGLWEVRWRQVWWKVWRKIWIQWQGQALLVLVFIVYKTQDRLVRRHPRLHYIDLIYEALQHSHRQLQQPC